MISILAAISDSFELSLIFKVTVMTLSAFVAIRVARQSPASTRHLVLSTAFAVLLVLPLGELFAPFQLELPLARTELMSGPARFARDGGVPTNNGTPAADGSIRTGPLLIPVVTVLRAAWLTGSILFLLPVVAGLWQLRRIRLRGVPWPHGSAMLRDLGNESGIKRSVDVLLSDRIPGPMTYGLIRFAIVFPQDAQSWSGEAVRRAILHELEHVRRGDALMHVLSRLACALYWFHPLVWTAWRRLNLEAEHACDDAVVSRADAAEYADQLLTLAARTTARARMPLPAMAHRGDLSSRITAILDCRQRRGRLKKSYVAAALILAVSLIAVVAPLRAVSTVRVPEPAQGSRFEVASVRPSRAVDGSAYGISPGGRLVARNVTVLQLIWFAHGDGYYHDGLVSGGPGWARSDRFDIEAKGPENATPKQLMAMLGSLLAERFNLKMHEETKQSPVYELVLARRDGRLGPKLQPTPAAESTYCAAAEATSSAAREFNADGTRRCSTTFRGGVKVRGRPLSDLTESLSELLERTVIDRTGLQGRFDADLEVSLNWDHVLGPGPADTVGTNAVIFSTLQEQLGLKLESARGPVRTILIDSVEKPAEN
jgi:uncharacterized protein (TIGR03435 family)